MRNIPPGYNDRKITMSRYAKAHQTIGDLEAKIEDAGGLYEAIYSDKVYKDLHQIKVEFENVEQFGIEDSYSLPGLDHMNGYEMIGEGDSTFPILWCAGGGDWELPLVFVLYIDQNGELRGYIPDDGNAYNHEENSAYGNNDGDPSYDDPRYIFDKTKMRADVYNGIVVRW